MHAVRGLWMSSVRNLAGPSSNPSHIIQGEAPPNQARPPKEELNSSQDPIRERGRACAIRRGRVDGVCGAVLGTTAIRLVGVAIGEEVVRREDCEL